MSKYQLVEITDFNGGLNNVDPPDKIADNEVSDILNYEYDVSGKSISPRKGTEEIMTRSNGPINGCFTFFKKAASNPTTIITLSTFPQTVLKVNSDFSVTDIGGGLGYPGGGVMWQFCAMNDTAIGVNGGTGANPVSWDGVSSAFAQLGGTPPKAIYCTTWNNRLWLVNRDADRVYWSALGNSADHTTSGIAGAGFVEVAYDDGDWITGFIAHNERLFIFKANHIYQVITANPNTDTTGWRLELVTGEIGCVSGFTIQPFKGDILFLSNRGVISLNAILYSGKVDYAILSKKINLDLPFNATPTSTPNFASATACVRMDKEQYWIAVKSKTANTYGGSPTNTGFFDFFVMDYSPEGKPRWTRFKFYSGEASWSAYSYRELTGNQWMGIGFVGTGWVNGKAYIFLGAGFPSAVTNNYPTWIWPNRATNENEKYMDAWNTGLQTTGVYLKHVQTKAMHFDKELTLKVMNKVIFNVQSNVNEVDLNVTWNIDEQDQSYTNYNQGYAKQINIPSDNKGKYYITHLWDTYIGRRFKTLKIRLTDIGAGKSYTIQGMGIQIRMLHEKYGSTATETTASPISSNKNIIPFFTGGYYV